MKSASNRGLRVACAVVLALGLVGCFNVLDRSLVTGKGEETYRSSLNKVISEIAQEQLDAFNWAVSNHSLDSLNAEHPNASARNIIHAQAERFLRQYGPNVEPLQRRLTDWEKLAAQVSAVEADDVQFRIEKDSFHGRMPVVISTFTNRSDIAFSQYTWMASLYLDDATEPVTQQTVTAFFNSAGNGPAGGFDPGESATMRFEMDSSRAPRTGRPWRSSALASTE